MERQQESSPSRFEYLVFAVFIALAIGMRVAHLEGPIDEPHGWRQSDTAFFTDTIYEAPLRGLLYPRVCWLGDDNVLAAEFPAYEFIVAMAYKVLGVRLVVARAVSLLLWAGAVFFLFKAVRVFSSLRMAWHVSVIYTLLPLGVFFSRAVHVEFTAILCAHAFLYYTLCAFATVRWRAIAAASLACTLAFLIKVPDCFYLVVPILIAAVLDQRGKRVRNVLLLAGIGVLPSLCFLAWRIHCGVINARPDGLFLNEKFIHTSAWFFGTLSMRLDGGLWRQMLYRMTGDVFTLTGLFLAGIGGLLWLSERERGWGVFGGWFAGSVVYVLIFFRLNVVHSYYQLPLLAPAAMLIAHCTRAVPRMCTGRGARPVGAAMLGLALAALLHSSLKAQGHYFSVDRLRLGAGAVIRAHTQPGDLVLTTVLGSYTETDDPRILYPSGRNGWSVPIRRLDTTLLQRYRQAGASYLAVLVHAGLPYAFDGPKLAALGHRSEYEIADASGQVLGRLLLYDL